MRKSLVSIRFEERRFWKMRTKHWLFIYFVSLLLLFFIVGEIGRYFSSIFIKSFPEILWPSLIIKDFFFFLNMIVGALLFDLLAWVFVIGWKARKLPPPFCFSLSIDLVIG